MLCMHGCICGMLPCLFSICAKKKLMPSPLLVLMCDWPAAAEILLHLVQDTVALLCWDLLSLGVFFHATAHPMKNATHLVGDTQNINPFKFSIQNVMARFYPYTMTLIFHAFIYIWPLPTSVSMQEEKTAHTKVLQLLFGTNHFGPHKDRSDGCYNKENHSSQQVSTKSTHLEGCVVWPFKWLATG